MDDGALVVFVDGFDAPAIVRNSHGGYGYDVTDVAAIRYRVDDLHADRIIYVTDARQHHHFELVFAVARMAGYLPDDVSTEHVGYGMVLGPDGKPFKTREGKRRHPRLACWTPAEEHAASRHRAGGDQVRRPVQPAAEGLRLRRRADDRRPPATPAPTCSTRTPAASRILRKAEAEGIAWESVTVLDEPAEQALALQLSRFGEIVAGVATDLQPHKLCTYLFELASTMSVFYEQCPVLKSEGEVRSSRLALCATTRKVLATGLGLLGIEAPDQM
jgi:arginyl-tRNA synthetase